MGFKPSKPNIEKVGRDAGNMIIKRTNLGALAIGVLIGAAIGAVVNSLANDVIMQAIARVSGFQSVDAMSTGTTRGDPNTGLPLDGIRYGKFLAALMSFTIIATCLLAATFTVLIIWRSLAQKKSLPPTPPTTDELILQELKQIKAALTAKNNEANKK